MKTIYICYDNKLIKSKFIENILATGSLSTAQTFNNIDIFKYLNLGIKNYIIHYTKIDSYAMYFLEQEKNNKSINIYIDIGTNKTENLNIKELFGAKYLSRKEKYSDPKTIDISNYISNEYLDKPQKTKLNMACGFLTEVSEMPQILENSLKSISDNNFKIRLFDNPNIRHPFNVGTSSEKQKYELMQSYRYHINIDDAYLKEAIISGCIVLDENLKEMHTDELNNEIKNILPLDTFIENFCL